MKSYEIYEFIEPHLGSIIFYGKTEYDKISNDSIKEYGSLINLLLMDLDKTVCRTRGRQEASAKMMLDTTLEQLTDIKESIERILEYVED